MKRYKFSTRKPTDTQSFSEASAEELRVLISVMESASGIDEADIARKAKVSAPRAKGALAFWEAEGIISSAEGSLAEEFEEVVRPGTIDEVASEEVAKNIRDEGISDLFAECAEMIDKPLLNTAEIKIISALVTQYALTPDYILTLAAFMKSKGKLTIQKLRDRAINLAAKGTDSTEALEIYLKNKEKQTSDEIEFRKLLGIYERNLSDAESAMFSKWGQQYGYSTAIVGEAYNLSVLNTGKLSLPYMDKVLTSWHESGCKTVEDCKTQAATKTAEPASSRKSAAPKKRQKSEPEAPRYGSFDIEDAFARALQRSYEEN